MGDKRSVFMLGKDISKNLEKEEKRAQRSKKINKTSKRTWTEFNEVDSKEMIAS